MIAKLNTAEVYAQASRLRSAAHSISVTGENVHLAWTHGLNPRVYTAPEAEELRQATLPVQTGTADFAGRLRKVAYALEQYADAVSPIKTRLQDLYGEATALEAKIKAEGADWTEDEDLVKENNRIEAAVRAQAMALSAAEQQCASAIYATYGGRPPAPPSGAAAAPTTPPWGTPEKADLPWYKDAWRGVGRFLRSFGLGFWDVTWGNFSALVGLQGWETAKAAWTQIGKFSLASALITAPGGAAALLDPKIRSFVWNSHKEQAKGLVAWDEWKRDPGRAAGQVFGNALLLASVKKTGGPASSAVGRGLQRAAVVGRAVDPFTALGKVGGGAWNLARNRIAPRLDADLPKLTSIPEPKPAKPGLGDYSTPGGAIGEVKHVQPIGRPATDPTFRPNTAHSAPREPALAGAPPRTTPHEINSSHNPLQNPHGPRTPGDDLTNTSGGPEAPGTADQTVAGGVPKTEPAKTPSGEAPTSGAVGKGDEPIGGHKDSQPSDGEPGAPRDHDGEPAAPAGRDAENGGPDTEHGSVSEETPPNRAPDANGGEDRKLAELQRGDDGRLHHPDDPEGTYRTEDGKLHFDGDPPNTFRNEYTHRLHGENGRFVEDPFAKRPFDYKADLGPTQKYMPSPEVAAEISELVKERAQLAGQRDSLRSQKEPLMEVFGIEEHKELSSAKLPERMLSLRRAVLKDGGLSAAEKAEKLAQLDQLERLAVRDNAIGKSMVRTSERMGMAAAQDFVRQRNAIQLTPLNDGPGRSGTLDVTAALTKENPPRLVIVEAKGGYSQLGARLVEGGKKAQQGTPEYLRSLLAIDPDLRAALEANPEVSRQLKEALDNGTLEIDYYLVRVDNSGKATWAQFNLSRDGAPFKPRRIVGLDAR
ncbi:hypothetical protein Arub01_30390 [Actinomadura rubrobrunea]|uniref:Uncharacterized protein n=2 Tax=Actinomadura rubrobrunea TaxID=115335 RepID=A0A9W6PUR6_9ACTN|nr:hypothetical protein Arub01_30390 [Actinomadura rubrobrunea]